MLARSAAGSIAARALGLVVALAPSARAQEPPDLVARTEPRSPEAEKAAFHLPPGFEAQLVAAEPQIHKPMDLSFDDRGRLWVTSSLEYPFGAKPGQRGRDSVVVLGDFGPDGRARSASTFVDGLNIPIGVLPLSPAEALVHSIPKIRRFVDADGDGRADAESDAFASIGFDDTHGMVNHFTRGFDGWIYACHGFANDSTVAGADGKSITMNSGNTFRMRPDGSHLERWSWGQVNPFGLAFDPLGNMFTCDCHSRPIYQILKGAYYPSFGKPHDGLGYGPEMMTHDHGSTGIGGLVSYAADGFPAAYRNALFVGNVVTSRINWDKTERHGSTLLGVAQPDFMTSDDPWFRPVDLTLGPDGALYVADFYNRIIGHYEVPLAHPGRDRERGRIWRIVYKGGDAKATPPPADFASEPVAGLVAALSHPNLAVRLRSADQLFARSATESGRAEVGGLVRSRAMAGLGVDRAPDATWFGLVHGLWVLERLGLLDGATLSAMAGDREPAPRIHALRVLAGRPTLDDLGRSIALRGLKDADAFARRAAAEALGAHPSPEFLRPLLTLRREVPADDTHLLHAARMALRDQLLDGPGYKAAEALPPTERDRRDLADVSLGVPTADSARFLLASLGAIAPDDDLTIRAVHHVARFGDPATVAGLVAFARADRPADLGRQSALLKAVHQGSEERGGALGADASAWAESLMGRVIGSADDAEAIRGIELAGGLKLASARPGLESLAGDVRGRGDRRLAAIDALAAIGPPPIALLGEVLGRREESIGLREHAAAVLAKINQPDAIDRLVAALPTAPGRVQSAIAVGLAGRNPGADRLIAAVAAGKASARLLQERPVQVQLKQANIPDLDARLAPILKDLPPAEQAIQALIARRRSGLSEGRGDAATGSKVFEKNCAGCHQIGGRGARVGPQLDGIGVRGPDRLLEDVLDPNRNVDQAFRTTVLGLKDGQVASGLLLREDGSILVLADAQGREVRVPAGEVDERRVAQLSPMPANMSDQIPEAEFFDLIAYLLSQDERKAGK